MSQRRSSIESNPAPSEDVAGGVGVGHRERAGAAGGLVGLLRLLQVPARPPARRGGSISLSSLRRQTTMFRGAAGLHRRAHVPQRRHRAGEEHGSHAREGVVEAAIELGVLHVHGREADVAGAAHLLGLALGDLDHALGDVDPECRALGTDQLGQAVGGVSEAAADVEDPIARLGRQRAQRRLAVGAETVGDDLAELHPAVEEDAVPGLGRLLVVDDHLLHRANARVAPPSAGGLDLQPRLLQVELALEPAHHLAGDLAAVAEPDQLVALGAVDARASSAARPATGPRCRPRPPSCPRGS